MSLNTFENTPDNSEMLERLSKSGFALVVGDLTADDIEMVAQRELDRQEEERSLREFEKNFEPNLYAANAALGEFCVSEGVQDIVFIDKSARGAWNTLSEYFNLAHPDLKKPGFHFINPSFLSKLTSGKSRGIFGGYLNSILEDLNNSEAFAELDEKGSDLLTKQDSKVLIFDACTHEGNTIDNVKSLLHHIGIKDIRTGVFTDQSEDNPLPFDLDFAFTTDPYALGCKPYGLDAGLSRGNSIHTTFDNDPVSNSQRAINRLGYRGIIRAHYDQSPNN